MFQRRVLLTTSLCQEKRQQRVAPDDHQTILSHQPNRGSGIPQLLPRFPFRGRKACKTGFKNAVAELRLFGLSLQCGQHFKPSRGKPGCGGVPQVMEHRQQAAIRSILRTGRLPQFLGHPDLLRQCLPLGLPLLEFSADCRAARKLPGIEQSTRSEPAGKHSGTCAADWLSQVRSQFLQRVELCQFLKGLSVGGVTKREFWIRSNHSNNVFCPDALRRKRLGALSRG